MIKKGFTLIEALVAILILGLVATLVIPTLASNIRKQTYASALSNAVTNFESAMEANMLKEGAYNLYETGAWRSIIFNKTTKDDELQYFMSNMGKTLALVGYDNTNKLTYKTLTGDVVKLKEDDFKGSIDPLDEAVRFFAKSGVEYKICTGEFLLEKKSETEALKNNVNYTQYLATVFIDVNGDKLPNILGKDLFWFELGVDGKLYPYGGKDYCYIHKIEEYSDVSTECVTNQKGEYCAAHLIKNGYKMDY